MKNSNTSQDPRSTKIRIRLLIASRVDAWEQQVAARNYITSRQIHRQPDNEPLALRF